MKTPILVLLILSCLITPVWAGGDEPIDNIGFMKNPPPELTQRFPMCDAFLKVDWIDKEKRIGQSHYELYKDGKKAGVMDALIYLDDLMLASRIELYDFKRKGELPRLRKALREGEIVWDGSLPIVKHGSYRRRLFSNNGEGCSYSQNMQNVCIAYPDNSKMWLVEGKEVGQVYTSDEIEEKYKIIRNFVPNVERELFKETKSLDINHDNVEDFVSRRFVIYSFNNEYFISNKERSFRKNGKKYDVISYPPSKDRCEILRVFDHSYTFDGESYFFKNQCNLTELTTGE